MIHKITSLRIIPRSSAIVLFSGLALTFACGRHGARLPNYGEVPRFFLTSQDGQSFDSTRLSGKVWVADFIFTTCGAACPMMTSRMSHLQRALRGYPDIRFVSFTVDPQRDTPSQLSVFAAAYHADLSSWSFLTGSRSELDKLGYNTFKLNHVDDNFQHSTRFALIDRHARIRGYYDSSDTSAIDKLLSDIKMLRGEGE